MDKHQVCATTSKVLSRLDRNESLLSLLSITVNKQIKKPKTQLVSSYCCIGAAGDAIINELDQLVSSPSLSTTTASCVNDKNILFRRISQRKLQASHILLLNNNNKISLLYESTSLFKPYWLLKRIQYSSDLIDDEEYYWIDWHESLDDAEQAYKGKNENEVNFDDIMRIKQQLQRTIDYDSSSSSSTSSSSSVCEFTATTTTTKRPVIYYDPPVDDDNQLYNTNDDYWDMYDNYLDC